MPVALMALIGIVGGLLVLVLLVSLTVAGGRRKDLSGGDGETPSPWLFMPSDDGSGGDHHGGHSGGHDGGHSGGGFDGGGGHGGHGGH